MTNQRKIQQIQSGSSFSTGEDLVVLQYAEAPRFDSRNPSGSEPGAFLAREWLRGKVAGRTVLVQEKKELKQVPRTVLADVFIGNTYMNEEVLKAGWARVQESRMTQFMNKRGLKGVEDVAGYVAEETDYEARCFVAAAVAQLSKKGLYDPSVIEEGKKLKFFDVTQKGPELQRFVEQNKHKEMSGFIEYIRGGDSFYLMVRNQNEITKLVGTPFGVNTLKAEEQQKILSEYLQRSCTVQIAADAVSNLVPVLLTYKMKSGDQVLSIRFLEEKTASVIDWMVQKSPYVSLFGAAVQAPAPRKVTQARIVQTLEQGTTYMAKVTDCQASDALIVTCGGPEHKVFIASLQVPKCHASAVESFGIEARQYLRGFFGHELELKVEYERKLEATEGQEAQTRVYGSFYFEGENIALELIKRGWAKVVKHRMTDPNRATDYSEYQVFEQQAIDQHIGVHAGITPITLMDISSLNPTEIKIKASSLGVQKATIEHIMAGGKIRLMLQNNFNASQVTTLTCTMVCTKVPSAKRGELCGEEAFQLMRQYLFRQVDVRFVGGVERHTNAYNALVMVDGTSLNVKLLENGFANFMSNKEVPQQLLNELQGAELRAKSKKLGIFGSAVHELQLPIGSFSSPIKLNVTGLAVEDNGDVVVRPKDAKVVQKALNGAQKLDVGKVGQVCLATYNGKLVRARINALPSEENKDYKITFIDFGKRGVVDSLYQISEAEATADGCVATVQLAFVAPDAKSDHWKRELVSELTAQIVDRELTLFCVGVDEYGTPQGFLQAKDGDLDVFETLNSFVLEEGLADLRETKGGEAMLEQMGGYEQNAVNAARGKWQ